MSDPMSGDTDVVETPKQKRLPGAIRIHHQRRDGDLTAIYPAAHATPPCPPRLVKSALAAIGVEGGISFVTQR